jgi:iron complex outermembrane receptor protein
MMSSGLRTPTPYTASRVLLLALAGSLLVDPAPAAPQPPADLTALSLEELMDVEVVSVSKRAEPISSAAAAVFVLTREDLRRSGATTIPEALRLVPGLQVARIDANKWAISARGFNGRFANKLLVLLDGRTVYTPLFSGVLWDVQDTLLEDVERIEVIRGPGATLWGANAVNGVINILTRPATDTQGTLVTAGGGAEERGFVAARYGGLLGAATAYRVYGKLFDRDAGVEVGGGEAADAWSVGRGGFRLERTLSEASALTLQGDGYRGEVGSALVVADVAALPNARQRTIRADDAIEGGNLLARWRHERRSGSEMRIQLYLDRTERDTAVVDETRDTWDLELQYAASATARQRLIWGLGFRRTADDIDGSDVLSFAPASRSDALWSAFLQDEITVVPERLSVIAGTKLEHNDYSGAEVQPTLRALWTPRPGHTVWAALSRAVRTPSRAEHDFRFNAATFPPNAFAPGAPPVISAAIGSRAFQPEELLAYELGWRTGVGERLFVDAAAFFHRYDRLRSTRVGDPFLEVAPPPPHLVVPALVRNDLEGDAYGLELAADWRPTEGLRLAAAYTLLELDLELRPGADDPAALAPEGESPRHQLHLRAAVDLARNLELDLAGRWVEELPAQAIPSYTALDLRLGWEPMAGLELALVGQNLLDDEHVEFTPEVLTTPSVALERSLYGKVTWRF